MEAVVEEVGSFRRFRRSLRRFRRNFRRLCPTNIYYLYFFYKYLVVLMGNHGLVTSDLLVLVELVKLGARAPGRRR